MGPPHLRHRGNRIGAHRRETRPTLTREIERVGARPMGPSGSMVAARAALHMCRSIWNRVETFGGEPSGKMDACVGSTPVNFAGFSDPLRYGGPPRRCRGSRPPSPERRSNISSPGHAAIFQACRGGFRRQAWVLVYASKGI